MTELELLIFQLNMANDTIRNLERIRENVLNKNDTLNKKLKIAEEAMQYYTDGEDMSEAKLQGSDAWRYIVDDNHTDTAQQALQKMKEAKDGN